MKIRSLLLGSAAAAGLATGAFAADPVSVLSALNACDSLGLSGLTIASNDNCVQLTGEVKWEGSWGNYKGNALITNVAAAGTAAGTPWNAMAPDGAAGTELDWDSKLEWWITVKATADTANGPASAVVKIKEVQQWQVQNEAPVAGKDNPYTPAVDPLPGTGGDHTFGLIADEAYVSIGAGNIWMIGKKGSIINKDDDEAYGLFQPFNSDKVDKGVFWSKGAPKTIGDGGVVIQTTMDLGNGFFVSGGLEQLDNVNTNNGGGMAGTAVGVLAYKGDGITAHVTGVAGGFLDGTIEMWAVHAGFTGTFDPVTVRGAAAFDSTGYYNLLATAKATFDMFTIAGAIETAGGGAAGAADWGVSGSVGANVTDGVAINVGGRFYAAAVGPDGYQGAIQLVAAVTETIKLTGEVGVYGNDAGTTIPYGAIEAAYAPGGDFTASIKGQVNANGAYKGTVKAGKKFQ